MKLEDLEKVYAKLPQVSVLAHEIGNTATRRIFLEGLLASSAPMLFGSLAAKCKAPILFVLQDAVPFLHQTFYQAKSNRQV